MVEASSTGPSEGMVVYADGTSRGNPGPAAAGYAVFDAGGRLLESGAEDLGEATNNVAEYRAVLLGLRRAAAHGRGEVRVRTDSQLVVRQMGGEYRVRAAGLRGLHREVREAGRRFARVSFEHAPRDDPGVKRVHALLERRVGVGTGRTAARDVGRDERAARRLREDDTDTP